jgi:hypothetical protein
MPRSPRQNAALFGALLTAATAGCNAILGLHEKRLEDGPDAGAGDGSVLADGAPADGAGTGDGPRAEGGPDGAPSDCPFDATGAGDPTSPACWTTFDLAGANPAVAVTPGTEGAAFDGRYLYIAPQPGTIVMRYDTNAPFGAAASWSSFDVQTKLGFKPQFSGAAFDGRYVTFVPYAASTLFVRFDTQAPFTDPASWSTYDPAPLGADAVGFAGATFDGQFLYVAPRDHTLLLRHDTRAAAGSGWDTFEIRQVQSTNLTEFWGGVYDGHAIYLAPNDGVVVRYDTAKPFASPTSWSKFDTKVFDALGLSFEGGAFDGRYVYLSPSGGESVTVRFDTQGTFTDAASWTSFDLGQVSNKVGILQGAAFDGRFVYLTPWGSRNFKPNTTMVRYDVTAPYDTLSSWRALDLATVGALPVGGSVFDGRYVYLMPDQGGTKVARFEAWSRTKKLTLPAFYGSFY